MATPSRSVRSLLALALVVNLVAAGAPDAALGGQRVDGTTRTRITGPVVHLGSGADRQAAAASRPAAVRISDYDRGPSLRQGLVAVRPTAPSIAETAAAPAVAWISRPRPDLPEPKAKSVSTSDAAGGDPASFKGRNHVWIPALGINRSVSFFSCSSSAYPGDRVYRWGCAGGNNVYLFGHAHSVFRSLHDAYVRGRLAKGMKVYYADSNGKVSTYAVAWWKVTTPDKGAWAYAGQSRPSLTLQTCVGAQSQYRLIVRLHKVG
jgi:sortase (surface protein transpeptidase)